MLAKACPLPQLSAGIRKSNRCCQYTRHTHTWARPPWRWCYALSPCWRHAQRSPFEMKPYRGMFTLARITLEAMFFPHVGATTDAKCEEGDRDQIVEGHVYTSDNLIQVYFTY